MKKKLIILNLILMVVLGSCKVDNYDAPSSTLKGKLYYNNTSIGLRSGAIQMELWQPGYQLNSKIPVNVDQNGEFAASLFDGTYKLTFLAGTGPWNATTDTVLVELKGSTVVDVPVVPFYYISNENITATNNQISSVFDIQKVNDARPLQSASLFVGVTSILDDKNNLIKKDLLSSEIPSIDERLHISLSLTEELQGRTYVFARLGLKITGVDEMIFTPVYKINL